MTDKEVMMNCCGVDDNGLPRAMAALKMAKIHVKEAREEIKDELILDTPVISMHRGPKFTMIDLIFQDPGDFSFVNCVGRLQKFFRIGHSSEHEDTDEAVIPTLAVTIAPRELMDEYFVSGMHGIFTVMPSHIGMPNDTLRFIFTNDSFHVFSMDEPERKKGRERDGD